MRILGKILTALIFLLFLFNAPSVADIISMKIRSQYEDTIELWKFGFSHTGFVTLAISSAAFSYLSFNSTLSPPDPSRVGFFLVSDELPEHSYLTSCAFDSKLIAVLFTFKDLTPHSHSSFNKTYAITYPGVYSLYFTNCNRQSSVAMDVHAEFYNTDHNNVKDYLPAGLTQLPSLYLRFSIIYLCLVVFWILVCFMNRRYFNRIHLVMGVFLVMAAFHYGCAAVVQQHLKVTATRPFGWNFLFYIFQFISNVLFFTVIGTVGWWPVVFPAKEVYVLILIIVQFCANITSMLVWESISDSDTWWFGVDWFCCFLSIIPIAILVSETKDIPSKLLLRLYMFLFVAVVYLIFKMIIALALSNSNLVINYYVTKETGTLVYCIVMFYMLRPVFDVDDQDEKSVELDEEFGRK